MNIQAPRGTKDVLPEVAPMWHAIERAVAETAVAYGYSEIRTPIFEQSALFKRSVGESSDIVTKEMYLFQDKGGEEFALRPELTASVVRASLENNLITGQAPLARLYYNSAPMFRYEKPQLGRQRQFHQFGTELLGPVGPEADAETILFAMSVYRKLGISNFKVRLNSLASKDARHRWRDELLVYLKQNEGNLSEESVKRMERSPLRVLDSKDERDRKVVANAPLLIDRLEGEDRDHFEAVKSLLTATGVEYFLDPLLVRGLDYYSRTVFELTSSDLGAQDALCGGGRYDELIQLLGGPATPAVGFAAGVERLIVILEKLENRGFSAKPVSAYFVAQEPEARRVAFEIAERLRSRGVSAMFDVQTRSFKAQMREANRLSAERVVIIGSDELAAGEATVKTMSNGEQARISLKELEREFDRS
jgi:histidyl-tRNA synthetase